MQVSINHITMVGQGNHRNTHTKIILRCLNGKKILKLQDLTIISILPLLHSVLVSVTSNWYSTGVDRPLVSTVMPVLNCLMFWYRSLQQH